MYKISSHNISSEKYSETISRVFLLRFFHVTNNYFSIKSHLGAAANGCTYTLQIKTMAQIFLIICAVTFILSSCTSVNTFNSTARAGDTIAATFEVGSYMATRENTIIRIKDANNVETTYYPEDTQVRAIIKMYPDPISYLVVATETGNNIRNNETLMGSYADSAAGGGRDWFQTVAFIDMPSTMAPGIATITLDSNEYLASTKVNIISGIGQKHTFVEKINPSGPTPDERLQGLERSPHSTVSISGSNNAAVVAADLTFSHDADIDNGGQGKAHVVAPRGDIASLNWFDTGTQLRVLVTPTNDLIKGPKKNLKFYIAGGLTGLALQNATAYDINGYIVPNITFKVSPLAHSILPADPAIPGSTLTLNGSNLCHDCSGPDSDVWLRINDQWSQITATSISKSSITFDVPTDAASGKGAIWVGTPAGETDKWFNIQ